MNLLADAVYKCLEDLRSNWNELEKPEEIDRCARYEFPKLAAETIVDQIIPQLTLYDVIFANRKNRYEAALYMGGENVLFMEPSDNYKLLEAAEHIKAFNVVTFL